MPFPDWPSLPRSSGQDEDHSLIRWMLSLSPAERLQVLQGFADSVSELCRDQPSVVQRRP